MGRDFIDAGNFSPKERAILKRAGMRIKVNGRL